jgi:DNA invertase Pin-like site-specific DNA recombinase
VPSTTTTRAISEARSSKARRRAEDRGLGQLHRYHDQPPVQPWSGRASAREDRPELARALECVREGDVLVVWRLDRLGRSLRHLLDVVHGLGEAGVQFRSLSDSIDATTSAESCSS